MLAKLIFLFVTVPLVDLILLMVLSSYIGWVASVAIVILSGVLGAWLAKLSYSYVVFRFTQSARRLQFSPDLLTDSAMIFFAAGLLLTPGILTDLFGFSLLIPACRRFYKPRLARWAKRNFQFQTFSTVEDPFSPYSNTANNANTVDGEVERTQSGFQPGAGPTSIETTKD